MSKDHKPDSEPRPGKPDDHRPSQDDWIRKDGNQKTTDWNPPPRPRPKDTNE